MHRFGTGDRKRTWTRAHGLLCLMLLAQAVLDIALAAEVTSARDAQTGLKSWTWREQGVSIQLLQLLPDQTRAFFIGRGFSADAADGVARACVFHTIFRNDGARPLSYDLGDWSVRHAGRQQPLRTRERWETRWQRQPLDPASTIAFYWALLPTVQTFQPGDYNWGMTSYGLKPGSRFDLSLRLDVAGQPVQGAIKGLECAPDN